MERYGLTSAGVISKLVRLLSGRHRKRWFVGQVTPSTFATKRFNDHRVVCAASEQGLPRATLSLSNMGRSPASPDSPRRS